jgi:ADP-heptose:LPS heptosyltransferase
MKIIKAARPNVIPKLPSIGKTIRFHGMFATVNDHVASVLVGTMPTFYSIEEDLQGENLKDRTFLIVRDMGLGDVLMVTPMIRALATLGAIVDVVCAKHYCALLEHNIYVRNVFPIECGESAKLPVLEEDYDAVIDLRFFVENEEFMQLHENRVVAFARALDLNLSTFQEKHLDYFVSSDEAQVADRTLCDWFRFCDLGTQGRPMVGYVWQSSCDNRNWSLSQHIRVIEDLSQFYQVILLGNDKVDLETDDQARVLQHRAILNMLGKTTIREAGALIGACDVVISPDTGLFHLASALDKPVVSVFGPMALSERSSHIKTVEVNTPSNCALFPCRNYYCFNRMADGMPKCLDVSVERVLESTRKALSMQPGVIV